MKRPPGPDLQQAVAFLLSADLAKGHPASFPDRPDYEFLARHASRLGHDLSPGAVQEAFRLIMRARLVASPKLAHNEGGGRSGQPPSAASRA